MADEYLTAEEIYARFPNQWVLLGSTRSDRYHNLRGGQVIAASRDRTEVEQHMEQPPGPGPYSFFHTGTRSFRVVRSGSGFGTLLKISLLLSLVVGVGWAASEVTLRTHVPFGVRTFPTCADALETHANSVRDGRLQPEPDPNGIVRYKLSDEVGEANVLVCLVRDDVIWYALPSHPLDGGSPYLVTPLDRAAAVYSLPGSGRYRTYQFSPLRGNWAYWFVLP